MLVILSVGPKCTPAASHAAPWWVVSHGEYADGTDRQTDKTDGRTNGRDTRPLHYAF